MRQLLNLWKRYGGLRTSLCVIVIVIVGWLYVTCLPDPLFHTPYSTVVEARDGQLLSAAVADDGQWRFPADQEVSERFAQALIAFEDKRFRYHPGFDPISMLRALWQNVRAGRIVSGGSTLSMQVIRLARDAPPRTVVEKITEVIMATRLEIRYSKEEILALYAAHAPFGGNVVGLEAACWRYFGRSPSELSWGEAATLAVLPNAPALIHPGRNREQLRGKRDRLLLRLAGMNEIDSLTAALAMQEAIPEAPRPLPGMSRHLLARAQRDGHRQRRVVTSLDFQLQRRVEQTLQQHHERLRGNEVHNGAVLVLDVQSGKTRAYAGNVYGEGHGSAVDIITAPRSTGSVLKPFLFAAALQEGMLLPGTLLPDIPIRLNGFAPQNFSRTFDGAVPADEALVRSLNIPSVFLLKNYRYEKFHLLLQQLGLTTLTRSADHYGLSLILGGAEGTLWDITGAYASMARTLNHYFDRAGALRVSRTDFRAPVYLRDAPEPAPEWEAHTLLNPAPVYQTLETLTALYRPLEEAGWKMFASSRKIAWKTGTSFGFRDGWAIGVTPDYAVGVWVGNADGEGRPGLTGSTAAAPLLFDIFSLLPATGWFRAPLSAMHEITVCRKSGQRAGPDCVDTRSEYVTPRGLETPSCAYHQRVHLSKDGRRRVHAGCASIDAMQTASWFVLPPIQEHYYRARHLSYKPLPVWDSNCREARPHAAMAMIYPQPNARIYVPRGGLATGEAVFELTHRDDDASVFWHLDGTYVGQTRGAHRLALSPEPGRHVLVVVDQFGHSIEERFTVLGAL